MMAMYLFIYLFSGCCVLYKALTLLLCEEIGTITVKACCVGVLAMLAGKANRVENQA